MADDERPDRISLVVAELPDWRVEELPELWSILLPDETEPVPLGPLLDELEPVPDDDELGCAGLESRFEVAEPDVLPNLLGFELELSLPDLLWDHAGATPTQVPANITAVNDQTFRVIFFSPFISHLGET